MFVVKTNARLNHLQAWTIRVTLSCTVTFIEYMDTDSRYTYMYVYFGVGRVRADIAMNIKKMQ